MVNVTDCLNGVKAMYDDLKWQMFTSALPNKMRFKNSIELIDLMIFNLKQLRDQIAEWEEQVS